MAVQSRPLEIQFWPIDRLVLYARNPRKNDGAGRWKRFHPKTSLQLQIWEAESAPGMAGFATCGPISICSESAPASSVEEMRRRVLESGLSTKLEVPDPHLYFQAREVNASGWSESRRTSPSMREPGQARTSPR